MEFHRYDDSYAYCKRRGLLKKLGVTGIEEFFETVGLSLVSNPDPVAFRNLEFEWDWIAMKRPYYNVYPSIIPMLTKLDLSLPANLLKPPETVDKFVIQLPKESNPLLPATTIWVSFIEVSNEHLPGIAIGVYRGCHTEPISIGGGEEFSLPEYATGIFDISSDQPISEIMHATPKQESYNISGAESIRNWTDCIRLAMTVCLLSHDESIVNPEILTKDQKKLDQNPEKIQEFIDRAKRRGKFGFTIGKELEVVPHYRRPHPALVWTGKGRKVPKIVMRSGSIVHRTTVNQVPTGYHDE